MFVLEIGGFKVGDWTVKEEAGKRHLIFDCRDCIYSTSIADDKACRFHVLKLLSEVQADLLVLAEVYERVYNEEQTAMLSEISALSQKFAVENITAYSNLGEVKETGESEEFATRYREVVRITQELISYDPIKAYIECLQELRREQEKFGKESEEYRKSSQVYLKTLRYIKSEFEKTELVKRAKEFLVKLREVPETKELYHAFFEAEIKPSFIGARLMFAEAPELELLDEYSVGKSSTQIFRHPSQTENLYFISPPEYALSPEKYFVLSKTKEIVAAYKPGKASLSTVARSREYFERIYQTTIADIAEKNDIKLSKDEVVELSSIVARYTVGYGILEILLSDRRITDIYLDSPIGQNPIYIVHSDYAQCKTNILYTETEAQALATKIRAMSARPFDEAHPVLDYDLPRLDSRVAVIGPPLAPDGIAYAFRLHKLTPWTLPQFIDVKFLTPLSAGLLSFLIDNQITMLIAGSRGSGKTSLVGACILEILKSSRVIVQEDSVTADCKIVVEKEGALIRTTVGKLVDELIESYGCEKVNGRELLPANPEEIQVFSLNKNGRMELSPVSQFMRHKVRKNIYEIETRTRKKIKVTADHSLFTLRNNEIVPIKPIELTEDSYIVTPRFLPHEMREIKYFNVLEHLDKFYSGYLVGEPVKELIVDKWSRIKVIAKQIGYSKKLHCAWKRNRVLPISVFKKLNVSILPENVFFKIDKKSKQIPVKIPLDESFLEFVGLWLADGCYDNKYAVIVSAKEFLPLIEKIANRFGLMVRQHKDGFSPIVSNTNLVFLMRKLLQLKGNAFTKTLPDWVFSLSKKQIASLLRGLYSGDGYNAKYEVGISLASKKLIDDLRFLLFFYGIVGRVSDIKKDKTYDCRISGIGMLKKFAENIGFLPGRKTEQLNKLIERKYTHNVSDIIPFSVEDRELMAAHIQNFNIYDYVTREHNIGRERLKTILTTQQASEFVERLQYLANSDIFWDQIKSIKCLGKIEQFVYDFSVPDKENFLCENIIAHNTLEISVPYMKKIGFNIQRLKTKSAVGGGAENELPADAALRTALRLGDSAIILGEVRSAEARTLYEAMRIGAAGNVVMGTIHADSAYAVWDRVVNDLQVPTTSFKATDVCIIARPIRFSGSLKSYRRVVQVTEIKKHWTKDPEEEGGLLDLMLFDAKKDSLELLEDNLKDSDLFEKIRRTSGLTIEEMWKEIKMRGDSKAFLVELKNKHSLPELLEANYTTAANDKLLLLKERHLETGGKLDYKAILGEWKYWAKNILLKKLLAEKEKSLKTKKS